MSQDKELNIEFKWPEYQGQSMPFLSQIKGELWACTELFPVFSSSKWNDFQPPILGILLAEPQV